MVNPSEKFKGRGVFSGKILVIHLSVTLEKNITPTQTKKMDRMMGEVAQEKAHPYLYEPKYGL
jgi:hypothetical protein